MNILITSAGRRTYLIEAFKAALCGKGKVYAANSVYTYTLSKADGYTITPLCYEEKYIPFILQFCNSHNITHIISLLDLDEEILSRHKAEFVAIGIQLLISDTEIIKLCNDKWSTYNFLLSQGMLQPKSFIKYEEVRDALHNGTICYPIIMKPRWGIGSYGIHIVDNDDELRVLSRKLDNQIQQSYIKEYNQTEQNIIFQEIIGGQEYGIEILNDLSGNYVTTFAKKKLSMRSGETDVAETVDPTLFEHAGHVISLALKHIGILDIDCFLTDDNQLFVIEMNCRFGGQYPFTHNAGANVPLQIVKWANGLPTDKSLVTQTNGVKSCKEILPIIM